MRKYLVAGLLLLHMSNADAYDDKITHRDITDKSARNSNLENYLIQNLGFKDGLNTKFPSNSETSVIYWLSKGSIAEDSPMCRASMRNQGQRPFKGWGR